MPVSTITDLSEDSTDSLDHLINERNPTQEGVVIGGSPPRARVFRQVISTIIVCLAPLSMGLSLGFSAPTIKDLTDAGLLRTKTQSSFYGSIMTVGAIAGGPIAGFASEKLGRKTTILMCCLPFAVGWVLIIAATSFPYLMCGRLLTGVGTGMCSLATPLYIGEISTKEMRGRLAAGFQLFVTLGILAVYGLGILLKWQWLATACCCVAAILSLAILPLPEAPRWLISKRYRVKGLLALRWLRGSEYDIEEECLEIEANLHSQAEAVHLTDICCKPALFKPLLISIGLMLFQQGSGINAFIFYTSTIFEAAGYKENAHLPTVIIGIAQVAATFISCILMDRAGRRILLLVSGTFMTLSSCSFGLYYYLTSVKEVEGLAWLSLTSLVVFVLAFSLGWGPIPWIVMCEIFPVQARGLASSIATVCNWASAFVITTEFHSLQVALQPYGAMWTFSGVCFLGILFVAIFMPETKGKSLEEIQEHFEER